MRRIDQIASRNPGVNHTVAIAGQSILLGANAPNFGAMFIMLKDFHKRSGAGLSADVISRQLQQDFNAEIKGGLVNIFGAPPVEGLGTAGGFKLILEDRGDNKLRDLQDTAEKIAMRGREIDRLKDLFSSFRADTPWLFLDINRDQAKTMGVSMTEIFNMLQVYLGSLYVNDFNRFGRTWQVNVQADAEYRERKASSSSTRSATWPARWCRWASIATIRDRSTARCWCNATTCILGPHRRQAGPRRQHRRGHPPDGASRQSRACREA